MGVGGGHDYPSWKYVSNCIDTKDAEKTLHGREKVFGNERTHYFANEDSSKLLNKDNFNSSASWYTWIKKIQVCSNMRKGR